MPIVDKGAWSILRRSSRGVECVRAECLGILPSCSIINDDYCVRRWGRRRSRLVQEQFIKQFQFFGWSALTERFDHRSTSYQHHKRRFRKRMVGFGWSDLPGWNRIEWISKRHNASLLQQCDLPTERGLRCLGVHQRRLESDSSAIQWNSL